VAEKPSVVMIVRNGGVPTIPEKMQGTPGLHDCAGECTGKMYGYLPSSMTPSAIREGHNPGPSKKKVAAAFREVYDNPPSTLKPGQSKAKRRSQMAAIAFSKARQKG
jgi:hypothetical protein